MIKKLERNIWIFPLISSIFLLVALLSPAAWYDGRYDGASTGYFYIWLWGLFSGWAPGYLPTISFTADPFALFPSVIITALIVVCFILILKSSYAVWKGEKNYQDGKKTWKVTLIILLISIVSWIVWMEIEIRIASQLAASFWSISFPGFGIIGIILAIVFLICGLVLIDYIKKHKREMESMEMKKDSEVEQSPPVISGTKKNDILWLGFKMNRNMAIIFAIVSIIGIIVSSLGIYAGVYNILLDIYYRNSVLYPHIIFFYVVSFILITVALLFSLYTLNKCREFQ